MIIRIPLWWRSVCRIREGLGEGVGRWFDDNIRRMLSDGRNTLFWHDNWVGDTPLRCKFPCLFDLAVSKECTVEDMCRAGWEVGGGGWEWRGRLLAWEEDSVKECSALLSNVVLQVNAHDSWRCLLDLHMVTRSGKLIAFLPIMVTLWIGHW